MQCPDYMLPNTESCKHVVVEPETAGIPERHLHMVAGLVVPLDGLPAASLPQKSERAPGSF
ncbi:MAG: hypothetical protein WBO06_14670 [Gammaproteobacteria bacterium]